MEAETSRVVYCRLAVEIIETRLDANLSENRVNFLANAIHCIDQIDFIC